MVSDQIDFDVVIIGAGMAGVAAAAELDARGKKKYVVLEARERIGGRLYTLESGEELGGAWLHEVPQNPLEEIAKKNGIETVYDDDHTILIGSDGVPLDPKLAGEIGSAFDKYRLKNAEVSLKQAAESFAETLDDPAKKKMALELALIPQLPNGETWELLSSRMPVGPAGLRDKAVIGGYKKILDAVAPSDFKNHLVSKSPVTAIVKTENGVEVHTKYSVYNAKSVVCTVPIGVLKSDAIKFVPSLRPEISKALKHTDVAELGKVYLSFSTSFWDESYYKFLITGKSPALVWNWSKVHPEFAKEPTICLIVCNDVIREIESDPTKAFEIVKPYLHLLAGKSKKSIPDPTNVITSSWLNDPFSKGAYSTYRRGNTRETAVKGFELGDYDGKLFFAGEHTTLTGATFIHGAFESGKRAVKSTINE